MALWALTNHWCFIGATPSINPSVFLLQLWYYGLLKINGALLEQHQLLILVSFLNYAIMIMKLWTLTYRWCLIGATPSIDPSVLLLHLWTYGLLQINGALLKQHQ